MLLKTFGQKLRQFRKKADLTQKELAATLFVSPELISIWERGYRHQERRWLPDRDSVLRLCHLFANHLTPPEAQEWVGLVGQQLSQAELQEIFQSCAPRQLPSLPTFYVNRIELQQTLLNTLKNNAGILVLLGMGGIGKTTLATWLGHTLADHFPDGIVWIDQQGDSNLGKIQEVIARSFGVVLSTSSLAERAGELRTLLYQKKCLLVLDDVWAASDLPHAVVGGYNSLVIITTRDAKVADILAGPLFRVPLLTPNEAQNLLAAWGSDNTGTDRLVTLLGGHPLALSLSAAQLRAGAQPADLLNQLQEKYYVDLNALDMDDPQDRAESLNHCFDLSYERLPAVLQRYFAQLSCFVGLFTAVTVAAIWGTDYPKTRQFLKKLARLALVEEKAEGYRLHPLLRAYARQKLLTWPDMARLTQTRHAAWYVRYALYHPGIMDDVTDPAPDIDDAWPDIIAAVKWAISSHPQLAASAALLAHTERPALLKEVGPALLASVITYAAQVDNEPERAILYELLGDLCLLTGDITTGQWYFEQVGELWAAIGRQLECSRTQLRLAGTYLLQQNQAAAAQSARQAQTCLAQNLPIKPADLETARWLFYWFDMVYNPLSRWAELPESDVSNLADLARQTGYSMLEARGLHIYRLWCTANAPRPVVARKQGRTLAVQAWQLWRVCGRTDRADDEICWTIYRLTGRYSQPAAARFARRRSRTTPTLNWLQIRLVKSEGMRWWLGATEAQRIAWLSRMLPRYLGATNAPDSSLSPHSRAWRWVNDILNVGMLGTGGRCLSLVNPLPAAHNLNGPEWCVLSGQKTLPLVGEMAALLVPRYLTMLDNYLSVVPKNEP